MSSHFASDHSDAPDASHANPPNAGTDGAATPMVTEPTPEQLARFDAARRRFLMLGGAGAAAFAVAAAARPAQAGLGGLGGFGITSEQQAARIAEELIEMNADFFTKATRFDFVGANARQGSVINMIAREDLETNDFLKAGLLLFKAADAGSFYSTNTSASPSPRFFSYPSKAFKNPSNTLEFGRMLKEATVAGFHGQVGNIKDKQLLGIAAAIAGVQGRHAALLCELTGMDPVPFAFQPAMSGPQVSKMLGKYGFSGGAARQ